MNRTRSIPVLLLGIMFAGAPVSADEPASYVDPLIGSWAPGFTNPGPVVPHGMAGLGPDTAEGPLNYGGYYVQNVGLMGFSHTHMSAGVPQGGQVPLMPVAGDVTLGWTTTDKPVPHYLSAFTHAGEIAEAGYYQVDLLRYGVAAELTATTRSGMHQYRFPPGAPARVVLDASRDLKGLHEASVTVAEDRVLTGRVRTSGPEHVVFFAVVFERAPEAIELFEGTTRAPAAGGASVNGENVGAIATFGSTGETLLVKVGLSYVSEDGALANVTAENPGWDFDAVRTRAWSAWNDALARIEVDGGNPADLRSFYTALYHAQLFPNVLSDADGRYPRLDAQETIDTVRDGQEAQYTQFSLWDSYRGQNALLAVIDPDGYRDMLRSLVNNVRNATHVALADRLPRWQLAHRRPNYMSGAPVIPFVAEGWCRGLVDDQDQEDLFEAMQAHLEKEWGTDDESFGYEPTPQPEDALEVLVEGSHRSAGRTLELGIADFALALLAEVTGRGDAAALTDRSLAYRHLLDPETRWIRPRDANGDFAEPFFPESDYGFQEGTSWQYSWLVPHDLAGLVERMDGPQAVNDRLDVFFGFPATAAVPVLWPKLQNQATLFGLVYRGNQYAPGNEHDLHAPYLYDYTGSPWKTQAVARGVTSLFTPTADGLPGNDDLGALSGWLVWSMLGLHPVTPGAPLYAVGSPVFPETTVHGADGDLVIEASGVSAAAKYVSDASVAGESLARPWLRHDETEGATLSLSMSEIPSPRWGASAEDRPPSVSTHPLSAFGCRPGN